MDSFKMKTKWQELLDKPKGYKEYNPTQTFALQVFWVVRSPTAAKEMIEKGFTPCAKATARDTPTTLTYYFRISRDQRLATKLKEEVKTIGQHPHYQPSFKSLSMGVPISSVELKLKSGGIDVKPLSYPQDDLISNHPELDFDPVVLECTEIYLDNRGFYEHAASSEWMTNSAEILKATRSLKPTTYCLGVPDQGIWEKAIEPSLKAIRFDVDPDELTKKIEPGVFIDLQEKQGPLLFIEMDATVSVESVESFRKVLTETQRETRALFMLVNPTTVGGPLIDVRITLAVLYDENGYYSGFGKLKGLCQVYQGRITSFSGYGSSEEESFNAAKAFVTATGLEKGWTVLKGEEGIRQGIIAGYPIHPLFQELVPDKNLVYEV